MKIVMNAKRKAILETLKNATEPMTLNEIAEKIGVEKVATGTTNPMIENGFIKVVGTKRVPVITYREVNVYAIGEVEPENENDNKAE
jgi:predicted transcriptional regulator